ncbi:MULTISPECIES: hypothetical protein [unclassified Enterococcus]|uniref:hypothetical protein n=1 Tax=unclassified Enterococcus TaxID=2608891 RepID=UPI000A345678|nr:MULTISPECIES: hypothetical protein [unclassified Enterococcus]OTO77374.1 hypothetical protein A5865_001250 [Enterococcus sp. 12E11_DIV0728]OUZ16451.1 hypothetical protein A5868_001372 [Enterococcus sp. 12F9_DIV0723]
MPNYLEIVRLHESSISQRSISQMLGTSRNTVSKVIKLVTAHQLSYQELVNWEPQKVEALFKSSKPANHRQEYFTMPDNERLAKELAKPGVILQLLWEEYVDQCRQSKLFYYQLTQFKKYFNEYLSQQPFSHIIHHKAGEKVQVDWAICKALHIAQSTSQSSPGFR